MSFSLLRERIRHSARESVRNGELTERGLARLTGFSQPHMHNVLKGVRILSTELADRLLRVLDLDVHDLAAGLSTTEPAFRSVPLIADIVGPGPASFCPHRISGHVSVPTHVACACACPVAAFVGDDFRLPQHLAPGDLVVIHRSEEFGSAIDPRAVYVVQSARGSRFTYVRRAGGKLFTCSGPYLRCPSGWEQISGPGEPSGNVLFGRVAWVSRQLLTLRRSAKPVTCEELRRKPPEFERLRPAS